MGIEWKRLALAWRLPELRRRILRLLGALALVRLLSHLPLPAQPADLVALFREDPFLALFDTFAGGAASRFSVLTLSLYPYLLAQLLLPMVLPGLHDDLISEGERGRVEWKTYVRRGTVIVAIAMGSGYLYILSRLGIDLHVDLLSAATIVAILSAGTMFLLWLGDSLEGDGVKWLIMGNVLTSTPQYLLGDVKFVRDAVIRVLVSAAVATVYLVLSQGQRVVRVQYAKRVQAMRGPGLGRRRGLESHIPLQFNRAGLTPLFYLLSILGTMHVGSRLFEGSDVSWIRSLVRVEQRLTDTRGTLFWLVFFFVGVAFRLAFGRARFNEKEFAETLRRGGGFIPGVRPGALTHQYLRNILRRFTWPEPILTLGLLTAPAFVYYGSGGRGIWPIMLISVTYLTGPILDLVRQLEAEVRSRHFERFVR